LNPVHCDAKSFAWLAKQWEKIWTKAEETESGRARERGTKREREEERE
jgi:hypothetical protein